MLPLAAQHNDLNKLRLCVDEAKEPVCRVARCDYFFACF